MGEISNRNMIVFLSFINIIYFEKMQFVTD